MKASYRTWVLLIGIGVAIVICVAALLVGATSATPFSMIPKKRPMPTNTPSVVIEKVLEHVDVTNLLAH